MSSIITVEQLVSDLVEIAKNVCVEEGIDYQEFIEALDSCL